MQNVGTIGQRSLREELRQQVVDKCGRTFPFDLLGNLQAGGAALESFRSRTRVGQHEGGNAFTIALHELEQRISPDAHAHEDRAGDVQPAAEAVEIISELRHKHGPVSGLGVTVRTQVGRDYAITRAELWHDRIPEMTIQRNGCSSTTSGPLPVIS